MQLSLSFWPTGRLRQFHVKQYRGKRCKKQKKKASEEILCVIGALAMVLSSALCRGWDKDQDGESERNCWSKLGWKDPWRHTDWDHSAQNIIKSHLLLNYAWCTSFISVTNIEVYCMKTPKGGHKKTPNKRSYHMLVNHCLFLVWVTSLS